MLQKQVVPIALRGVDTSKDPKVLGPGLSRLENGRIDRLGAITKRYGQTDYAASRSEPFITSLDDQAIVIGESSLRVDDGTAFDAATTSIGFADIDPQCVASKKRATFFYPDIAVLAGVIIYVWTDYSNQSGNYQVTIETRDRQTGLLIATSTPFPSNASKHYGKVCIENTTAVVFSLNGTTGRPVYVTVSAAGAIGALTDVDGALPDIKALSSSGSFDAIACGDVNRTLALSYINVNDDVTYLLWRSATGTVASASITTTATCTGLWKHGTGEYGLAYYDSSRRVRILTFDDALATLGADDVVETLAADWRVSCFTGCQNAAGTGSFCYYTAVYSTTGALDPQVRSTSVSRSGSTLTFAVAERIRRAKIASRPWSTSTDTYIICRHRAKPNSGGDSDISTAAQSGYYLFSLLARTGQSTDQGFETSGMGMVGKALVNRAGANELGTDVSVDSACSVLNITSNTTYWTALLGWTSGQINPSDTVMNRPSSFDDVAVYKTVITPGAPSTLRTQEQAGLFIPNSCPYQWDGLRLFEQGFTMYPEGLTIAESTVAGTPRLATTSKFTYVACYEHTDRRGQVHRSSPSPAIAKTLTGTNNTLTITVPTLGISRRQNVSIVLYRTDANGSTYYRLASTPNTYADSVSFVDDGANVTVAGVTSTSYTGTGTSLLSTSGAPWVYTTGNVVENVQPQPHRIACLHQGRHIYADREYESTVVRYSRYITDGEGVGHNDQMLIVVPQDGGAITGLASFMDRLLIFKADRIYVTVGSGLSDAATGQDYASPTLLSAGFGCALHKSIVQLPGGLAFLSSRGLVMLGPDMGVDPNFGAPVKYHTDTLTVSAGNLVAQKGYAIWTTTTGVALVCFYQWGQWSTYTNHAASDATVVGGLLYRHYSTTVSKENRSSYLDTSGTTPVVMKLVTGWISLSQLLGFGRLYRVQLLGQNISTHVLNLQMGYDFDAEWQTAQTFTSTGLTEFDYDAHYGAGSSTYADDAYLLEADAIRQKLTAVRFMVFDSGSLVAEAYSISALSLLVGVKPSLWRSDATRRMS